MARSSILGTLFARRSQTSEHRAALIPDRPTNIPPGTGRSCGWRQFHFSFLIRRKPQSKSLARALAQLMERQLQSTGAGIWALSWLRALNGASKQELLSDHFSPIPGYWDENPLVAQIAEIAAGSFKHREPPVIAGSGYVVKSLEAGLWAFHSGNDFRGGCLLAVNLGADADTTGAIYGQLAGAFYGESAIPLAWSEKLAHRGLIASFADKLLALSFL